MNLALLTLSTLALALSIPTVKNAVEDTKAYSADELRSLITLRGKSFQETGDIVMDWSGSGFEFYVEGTTYIDASFVSPNGKIAIEVDGQATRHFIRGEEKTRLASNLSLGEKHLVRVYKDNEAGGALCALSSLTVEEGTKLSKTPAKKKKFDFLGASITCANQIDHEKGISAYGGYARYLSDMFDADFHSTCISGRGLMEGYNSESSWSAKNVDQLKDVYFTSSFYRDRNKQYDLSSYDPDVIVLNVGDNDLGKNIMAAFNTTIDSYLAEVDTFHHKVRKAYPNAFILYMYGTYQNRWFDQEYRAKVEALNEEDGKSYFYYMPFYADGADDHPSEIQHKEIATRLANVLVDELGYEPEVDLLFPETRVEAEDMDRIGFMSANSPVNTDEFIHASEWHYVGSLNTSKAVEDPEDISMAGHNLKILTTEFTVPKEKAGKTAFTLGYQADYASHCYVKIDEEGQWKKVDLPKTQASTTWESERIEFDVSSGFHEIFITGPNEIATSDRYDYFELQPLTPRIKKAEPQPADPSSSSNSSSESKSGGCRGSIIGGSIIASSLLLGAVLVIAKKRKES